MTNTLTQTSITQFQHKILSWYEHHQRALPWREVPFGISFQDVIPECAYDERAYRILVSEVMAQQTQLSRVIPKFEAWMQTFPTLQSLAEASVSDVLRSWSGLGYNRRALNLQRTAKMIVTEYNGIWPKTLDGLKKLPGIGDYTAAAVACFAFGQQVAVVDTNVRKVILLEFFCHCEPAKPEKQSLEHNSDCRASAKSDLASLAMTQQELQHLADQLLPQTDAYHWNQALMDYAGAELKAEKIAIPKQSRFIGSKRYYRGKILKVLLQQANKLSVLQLAQQLGDGTSQMDSIVLKGVLQELERDGFIKQARGYVMITAK